MSEVRRGLQRLPVTDLAELEGARELVRRLLEIPELVRRYERVVQVQPKLTSELGDDDRRTSFLQLSHFASASMSVATDSLFAVKKILLADNVHLEHHLTAQFLLIRSTIEAAATSLWLMRPDQRRERVLRLLQARTTDVDYHVQLMKAAAGAMQSMSRNSDTLTQKGVRDASRMRKKHKAQMQVIARNAGIEPSEYETGAPGYEALIAEAAADGGRTASVWKLVSGLTHPSPLRLLHTSKAEELDRHDDGTSFVLSSMNTQTTTVSVMAAMAMYRYATEFRRYRTIRPAGR